MAMRRDRAVEFSQPVRHIALMLGALAATGAVGWLLREPILGVVRSNPYLNGLIVGVFLIGVVACFAAVLRLTASVSWIEGFAADRAGHEFAAPPRLMASLSALLRERGARTALTSTSTRSILDSVATRLDEARDIMRYLGNLLIFLGLLGTFWGLSTTVPAVVDTIRSLAPDAEGGASGVFDRLMAGLEDQLGGMGTAFSSSLLGLAGSLVIGLLELFVGHAQNRFFRELEEWLSSITRISYGDEGGGEGGLAATLVEQNAVQIETLTTLAQGADGRRAAFDDRLAALTDSVSRLTGALSEREAAGGDARVVTLLETIAARLEKPQGDGDGDGDGFDDLEVRSRLRSIDRHLLRLLEDSAAGRQDAVAELRAELNTLARAVTQLSQRDGR